MSSTPFKITKFGIVGNLTGSVQGTASHAVVADSASYVESVVSSSYALTASYAENAGGSEVVVSASLDAGIKIAEITVDGTGSSIYIPSESYATEEYVEAQGVTEPEMDIIFGYSRDSVTLDPISSQEYQQNNFIRIEFTPAASSSDSDDSR